jgi:hypothetical protein
MSEREGLIARIRVLRRTTALADLRPARTLGSAGEESEVHALARRVAHLEKLLEGLQDSVHRESLRQSSRISELEAQVQPAALTEALSNDARARGL